MMTESNTELFARLLDRERKARKEAERILEEKSYELYQLNKKLIKQTQTLDARVKERTKQLEDAKARAEFAAKEKLEFLANMSHEIRTPLNAIIGMNSILMEEHLTPRQEDFVCSIYHSSEVLLRIINDILDFSKLNEGKLTIENNRFSIIQVVDRVFELLRLSAANKGILLLLFIDPDLPRSLHGDPGRIQQILLNLVDNAIKFTSEGHVCIRLKCLSINPADCLIQINVEDTGIGMSPDQMSKIFNPFTQAREGVTRNYGGTGLGLVIAQRLSQLMSGDIKVTSTLYSGSVFTLEIPFVHSFPSESNSMDTFTLPDVRFLISSENELLTEHTASILHVLYGETLIDSTSHSPFSQILEFTRDHCLVWLVDIDRLSPAEIEKLKTALKKRHTNLKVVLMSSDNASPIDVSSPDVEFLLVPSSVNKLSKVLSTLLKLGESPFSSKNDLRLSEVNPSLSFDNTYILLAEDNLINQNVCKELLTMLGIHVDIASNGIEVLNMIRLFEYDMILMDIQMPEMNGVEATRKIREMGSTIPIVALTANVMPEDRSRFLEAGMNDFIAKPILKNEIATVLKKFFSLCAVESPSDSSDAIQHYVDENLDLRAISEIFMGDEPKLRILLKEFSQHAHNLIETAANLIETEEWSLLDSLFHKFEGSALTVGATSLARNISSCRQLASSPNPGDVLWHSLLSTLNQALGKMDATIDRIF